MGRHGGIQYRRDSRSERRRRKFQAIFRISLGTLALSTVAVVVLALSR